MTVEYASQRRGIGPYESLAQRTGLPLPRIVELATQNRLGELFDSRGHIRRPLTPAEALRQLEEIRHGRRRPLSPAAAKVILRFYMRKWDNEIRERERRRRDPHYRLAELRAVQIPPWWGR